MSAWQTAHADKAAQQAQSDRAGRRQAAAEPRVSNLAHSELPPGDTWTGSPRELQAGDYLQASVHGYSKVESVRHPEGFNFSHIQFAGGGSESGYPYSRAIHRPYPDKDAHGTQMEREAQFHAAQDERSRDH